MNAFVTRDQEDEAIEVLAKVFREAWHEVDQRQKHDWATKPRAEQPEEGARSRAGIEAVLGKVQEAIQASPIGWRAEWKRLIEYIGDQK